jgi:hypothetical protein
MSGPVHILDHQARAVRRLVLQYREAANLQGLVSVSTAEHQTLEDQFWQMFAETIDTAEDAQLDVYGRIVNQAREGRDDPTYRLWIKTRVRINRSCGSIPEIVGILMALVSGTTFVRLEEQFPAAIEVHMGYTPALDWEQGIVILRKCKAGGVRVLLTVEGADESEMLHLDSPDGPGLDVGYLADYWE